MLLGFDIGGTKCAVVLGEKHGEEKINIVDKVVVPTDKSVQEMMEALFHTADVLMAKNEVANNRLKGIGISCGGPLNSKSGLILSPPNLPGWDNIAIVDIVEKRFGRNAYLQNDANACAVAEWKYGAGRGYENIIFLTFGTGMGAGLILNGKLYSGTSDHAGEAGHMRLADVGPVGFGKSGSFEGFCSGGGIAQLARMKAMEKMQMGERTSFCNGIDDLPSITAKAIAEAAYKGDALAIDIYKTSATYLGKGISLLMDLLNPEVIVIGGIYVRAQTLLETTMMEVIEKEVLQGAYRNCKIVPAQLAENIGDIAALALADQE